MGYDDLTDEEKQALKDKRRLAWNDKPLEKMQKGFNYADNSKPTPEDSITNIKDRLKKTFHGYFTKK